MDDFKEFEGKNLDTCIRSACEYFDAPREKLEIEIIQDAKSGIFGIVLARKAKIRARRARLANAVQAILKEEKSPASRQIPEQAHAEASKSQRPAREKGRAKVSEKNSPKPASVASRPPRKTKPAKELRETQEIREETLLPEDNTLAIPEVDAILEDEQELTGSSRPLVSPDELDREKLAEKTVEIVQILVAPLAGHAVEVKARVDHGSVHAAVAWQGDAGLLIGREGQTLAALQYLASRMLSHAFNAALRVQLDIGEYRSRQDDKLRALARTLAEKARQQGRSFSTRPLSSYHRRIVHLALQDQTDLITRSSGDGSMKRVVIALRRSQEK